MPTPRLPPPQPSVVLAEQVVRNSYLEQARLCQTHRWLAAVLQPATRLAADEGVTVGLFAKNMGVTLDGQVLPVNAQGLPSLGFTVADLAVADVTSTAALYLDVRSLRVAGTDKAHDRALITIAFGDGDLLLPPIASVTIETQNSATSTKSPSPTDNPDQPPLFPANCSGPLGDGWVAHRLLALKHRWHTLGESPSGDHFTRVHHGLGHGFSSRLCRA